MRALIKIFGILKEHLDKNRVLLLFGFTSFVITTIYPDVRRFPYGWKKNSQWAHEDLYAEFTFVLPDKPAKLKKIEGTEAKKSIAYYYHTGEKPLIKINAERNLIDEKYAIEIQQLIQEKFRFTIDDKYVIRPLDHVVNYVLNAEGDTIVVKNEQLVPVSKVKSTVAEILKKKDPAAGRLINEVNIQVVPNVLPLKGIQQALSFSDNTLQKSELIREGQLLVKKGQFIDENLHQVLKTYRELYITGYPNGIKSYLVFFGRWILVAFVLLMLYQFLYFFRPNVFEDSSKLLMILSLVLLFFVATIQAYNQREDWIYYMPLPIVPVVLKAFYDTRLALFTHFLLLLLLGIVLHDVYSFYVLHFTAGVISIITVESIYKRSQLFTSVFKIIAVYILLYFALELTDGTVFKYGVDNYVKLVVNAFFILLAFPLIYSIEKIFGMISDLSLLELSDTNMPLLKELAEKAPGTFQHSLQVASLAESAAAAIGANTLLVRTAALYHDIGKMKHPQYFIENQITGYNPHDELSFEESARVIIDHVKEGIKIARERKLPESIIDFIRTHHGTTKVQYFYKMYLKNYTQGTGSEESFRYPGPTPFSKETAILMLADSVEASCRSLAQAGADKTQIEKQIDLIFESLMEQRQLDNANITLSEISMVIATLKKKISNIYHNRIQYPK